MTTEIDYVKFIKISNNLYEEDGNVYIDKLKQDISKPPSFPITREPNYVELIDGINFLKENKPKKRIIIKEGFMCHYILFLERHDKLFKLCEINTHYLDKFPKDFFNLAIES
jgi:hypothetical protein